MVSKIITIDGGAQTGKSTAGRTLAALLGWEFLSTGIFYRAAAWLAEREGIEPAQAGRLVGRIQEGALFFERGRMHYGNGEAREEITQAIFEHRVGAMTPRFSQIAIVREALLDAQRRVVGAGAGLVVDGRDCGTIVFPYAPLKFWLTVSPEKAAERMVRSGGLSFGEAYARVLQRDATDRQRISAPMAAAPDALPLETSNLTPAMVVEIMVHLCAERALLPREGLPAVLGKLAELGW